MSFLGFCRRAAYFTLDGLKGGVVRKAIKEIGRIDMLDSVSTEVKEYQKAKWEMLRDNITRNVPFYKDYAGKNLSEFPVVNKLMVKEGGDDFFSSAYRKEDLVQMATSGSTGTPFISYQNGSKKKRVNAEIMYYSGKVGYKLGENLSYIRSIVRRVKKSPLKQFIQNQTMIPCNDLSDKGVEAILDALERQSRKGPVTLLAYASTYTAISDYHRRKCATPPHRIRLTGCISGSEMLFDSTREGVAKCFGLDQSLVVSRYSNEENGVLGQDEGINNVYPVNEADYIIEVLDDEGRALPDGEIGRIVVTDLFNYAAPLVRYDTGDCGALETISLNGRKKRCITKFSGRKVDLITDSNGNLVSPYQISNCMWDFQNVRQFQLIQKTATKYILKINVTENFDNADEIICTLKSVLGTLAEIEIERVDEIPVLASGKRRFIVNEYQAH